MSIKLTTYNKIDIDNTSGIFEVHIQGLDISFATEEDVSNILSVLIDGHGHDFESLAELYFSKTNHPEKDEEILSTQKVIENILSGNFCGITEIKNKLKQLSSMSLSNLKAALK